MSVKIVIILNKFGASVLYKRNKIIYKCKKKSLKKSNKF